MWIYVIFTSCECFIAEDNILWHYDNNGSLENLSQGYKIDLINYPLDCNGYRVSLVFPPFLTF